MISITKESLLPAIQFAASASKKGGTLPILSNLLIKVSGGILTATGTNLESEITAKVACDDSVDCEFTAPAKKLVDVVKALPSSSVVKIDFDGESLILKSGRSKFKLSTLPVDDFPESRKVEVSSKIKVDQQDLKRLITSVSYAMAKQDVRYYLNGMLLELGGGKLTAVATDGHRMALADTDTDSTESISIIIPNETVVELGKMLKSGVIELELSENSIRVDTEFFTFASKLIDGKFPDYRRVIPVGGGCRIVAGRDMLLHTLSQVAIMSNQKYRGIRVFAGDGVMTMTANNPENETAESVIEVSYTGDPVEIGFNAEYLISAIGSISGSNIEILLRDSNSSAIVRELGDESSLNVVMPMRL